MDFIRRLGGPPPRQPRVVVTAVIDGTDGHLDAHAMYRLRELTDAVRDSAGDISATVDLYRAAPGPQDGKTYVDRLVASDRESFEEAWSGQRTFQIDAHRVEKKGPPKGRPAVGDAETSLARNLRENQRRYPDALHIVYAYGHRSQGDKVAGLRVDRLKEALGSGADLMLLDTCWGSSVDTLAHIPRSVKTVAAAQSRLVESVRVENFFTPVFESQFPLRRTVLAVAQRADRSPQTLGTTVVAEGARLNAPHVIAATDMEALHNRLLPALDQLGRTLPLETRPTEMSAPVHNSPEQFSDLAGYLRHLGTSPLSAAATAATRAVSDALSRTLVARHVSPDMEGHGGMSFHLKPGAVMPAGWKDLVGS